MKTEIIEKQIPKPRLPEVGEPWGYKGVGYVYFRIKDNHGCAGLRHQPADMDTFFYSIDNNGIIFPTPRNQSAYIRILRPVGGVLKFEPVEE